MLINIWCGDRPGQTRMSPSMNTNSLQPSFPPRAVTSCRYGPDSMLLHEYSKMTFLEENDLCGLCRVPLCSCQLVVQHILFGHDLCVMWHHRRWCRAMSLSHVVISLGEVPCDIPTPPHLDGHYSYIRPKKKKICFWSMDGSKIGRQINTKKNATALYYQDALICLLCQVLKLRSSIICSWDIWV